MVNGDGHVLASFVPRAISQNLANRRPEDAIRPFVETFAGTVVLVDMVGFTDLTEQLMDAASADGHRRGPERVLERLNPYLARLAEVIGAHGGDIVCFAGDAVQAVWRSGAMPSLAAQQAVNCCLRLLVDFDTSEAQRETVQHRITVASGEMMLASLGSIDTVWNHVLLGEPVVKAALAQDSAEPGSIVADMSAWILLQSTCIGEPLSNGLTRVQKVLIEPPPIRAPPPLDVAADDVLADRVPKFIRDALSTGESFWLAEFRNLSVVFVRLDLPASDAVHLEELGRATAPIYAALSHLDGAVDKVIADPYLQYCLVFGSPEHAHSDDAVRAVAVAKEIHRSLSKLGIQTAIGIASGWMICGLCGDSSRRQYMLYGRPINLAARLMQSAREDILADAATRDAASSMFVFEELAAQRLKGFRQPTPAFRVIDTAPQLSVASNGPLIGRDSEWALLAQTIETPTSTSESKIGIVAAAGIGKSRLLKEVGSRALASGIRVVATQGREFAQSDPYFAWRSLLLGLLDTRAVERRGAQAVLEMLLEADPDVIRFVPLLDDIVSLRIKQTSLTRLMTGQPRVDSLHELIAAIVRAAAAKRRLAILVDDAQWLDHSSTAMLAKVANLSGVCLVAAARASEDGRSTVLNALNIPAERQIALHPFSQAELSSLAAAVLGVSDIPSRLTDFLVAQTDGNVLHAEELLHSLKDEGVIHVHGDRATFHPEVPAGSVGKVPVLLGDIVVSRLDRLTPAAREIARFASAFGRPFSSDELRKVFAKELSKQPLDGLVGDLVSKDFVKSSTAERNVFEFKHALTRQAIYERVPFEQREAWHGKIARWLEQTATPETDYSELAFHCEAAREYDAAAQYLERVAEKALRSYANQEAADYMSKALSFDSMGLLSVDSSHRARWEMLRADALHNLSLFSQAKPHYRSALRLLGTRVPETKAALSAGTVLELLRQFKTRVRGRRRRPAFDAADRSAAAAHVYAKMAEESFFQADASAVVHQTIASINFAERADAAVETMNGFAALAIGLCLGGLSRLARYYNALAVKLAASRGSEVDIAYVQVLTMVLASGLGDWGKVRELGERAVETFEKYGDHWRWHLVQSLRFFADFCAGEFEPAASILAKAEAAITSETPQQIVAWTLCSRLLLDLVVGEPRANLLVRLERILAHDASVQGSDRQPELDQSSRMLCRGVLASAFQRLGNEKSALAHAAPGLEILESNAPTIGGGFLYSAAGIADVLISAIERQALTGRHDPDIVAKARKAVKALNRVSRKLIVYRPVAAFAAARLASISQKPGRAGRLWLASARSAHKLSFEHVRAQAVFELARQLKPEDPVRFRQLQESGEAFRRIGARADFAKVERLLN